MRLLIGWRAADLPCAEGMASEDGVSLEGGYDLNGIFAEEARGLADELVKLRREFHMHPEIGFGELKTAEKAAAYLESLGYEVRRGVGRTGVVAVLKGATEGPTVALRADMDALPIQEQTEAPYASRNPGVMHACGHDAHVTCALGAARLLAAHRRELQGSVKVMIQPAEEIVGGAREMIAEGVLEDPHVDMIFGLHCEPQVPVGKVAVSAGPLMAAADLFSITVTGQGGHGAAPHLSRDPVVAAASIIMNLQTLVSRVKDPQQPAVLSVCSIHGGTAHNIIPEKIELSGTVRTFDRFLRDTIEQRMDRMIQLTAESLGVQAALTYKRGVSPVINDGRAAEIAAGAAKAVAGADAVVPAAATMGGEDFSLFLDHVPGCFMWLGVGNPGRGITHPWHSPCFDIDESALPIGAGVLAECVFGAIAALSAK